FSVQTDSANQITTHRFTLSDFVPAPPLPPGARVCLIRTDQGWMPQAVTASGTYGSGSALVNDTATLTVSADGTYKIQRHRTGAVFSFLDGFQGTLDDVLTTNLETGKSIQNTAGSAQSTIGAGSYQEQFTLYSDVEL